MKKILSLMPVFMLVLSILCGCGSSERVGGTVTPNPPETTGQAVQDADVSDSDTTAGESTDTEVKETEPPVYLGRMEGGVYTNTYAGFGCTLDESWTIYGAQELQELPGAVRDALEGSDLGQALADVEQITDMMAENPDMMVGMNLLYQKQDLRTRLEAAATSEADLVDSVLTQVDTMTALYSQMGITVETMERAGVKFLGEDRWAIRTVGSSQGIPLYMVQLFDFTRGSYALTLTITSFMEDKTDQVLALYYAVD